MRLSAKALRIYRRVGLPEPIAVESNGYRRYEEAEVRTGQPIGMLRGAGLGLAEIALVLEGLDDPEAAVTRLERLLGEREREHTNRRLLIRHIQAMLRKGEGSMCPIRTRHVPASRVMSMQRRLYAHETGAFAREAKAATRAPRSTTPASNCAKATIRMRSASSRAPCQAAATHGCGWRVSRPRSMRGSVPRASGSRYGRMRTTRRRASSSIAAAT